MTSSNDGGHDGDSGEAPAGGAESGQKRKRRRRHRKPGDAPPTEARQSEQPSRSTQRPQRPVARTDGSGPGDRQGLPKRAPRQGAPSNHRTPEPPPRRTIANPGAGERSGARDSEQPRQIRRTADLELADDAGPSDPSGAWGSDDDLPVKPFSLVSEFPPEPPATDPDPVSCELVDGPTASVAEDLTTVIAVRFVAAGRIAWCSAGEQYYSPGDRVLVESDRGPRLAWVVTAPSRKPVVERGMRRVIRIATDRDLGGERSNDAHQARALRVAKDAAAELRLPLKVFRVEVSGGKLIVYYTTEERVDVRDFARSVSQAMSMRIELRQIGGRDEAKLVGGIGSCGLPLCCTTWLPEFVPVSIKMAKDQGLVLSPTRVSGQCGRLKCCLVYEQEAYAELRKGLPKLGKRVVSARGEGRIVEVDVLTQRVRVSYAPGDTELLPANEVKPLFPSGAVSGRTDNAVRGETARRDESDDTAQDDDFRPSDNIPDEDSADSTDESA